jgi:hypothetical protein
MANKDNPSMRLVNLWMTRSDADAHIRIANAQGLVARIVLEHHG